MADGQGARVLGALDSLADGQQGGELVAGPGRIPRLPVSCPTFPGQGICEYLRGCLHFQQLVHDFLRSPVLEC